MSVYFPVTQVSGLGLYGVLVTPGKQWVNVTTPENFNSANWSGYVQVTTDEGNGIYWVLIPAGLAAGTYLLVMYLPGGSSQAFGDVPYFDAPFVVPWTGTALQPVQTGDSYGAIQSGVTLSPVGQPLIAGSVASPSIPTTNSFVASPGLSTEDNFYRGTKVAFTSGALKSISRFVTSYQGSTRTFVFVDPWPNAPGEEDEFQIIGGNQ